MLVLVTFTSCIIAVFLCIKWRDKELAIFALVMAVLCAAQCVRIIPKNNLAVTRVLGFTSQDIMQPGIYFTNPMRHVVLFSTQSQKLDYITSALSKEGLEVFVQMKVEYKLMPEGIRALYVNVGPDVVEKMIQPEINNALRHILGRYNIDELSIVGGKIKGLLISQVRQLLESRKIQVISLDSVIVKQ